MPIIVTGPMYKINSRFDRLRVCIAGRSYAPEFYGFIKNDRVRSVFERMAAEIEEDYQKLIAVLESLDVRVLRPRVHTDWQFYLQDNKIIKPPMSPRDYTILLGQDFYLTHSNPPLNYIVEKWDELRGSSWPETIRLDQLDQLPESIKNEIHNFTGIKIVDQCSLVSDEQTDFTWGHIIQDVQAQGNQVFTQGPWYTSQPIFCTASMFQLGQDIYVGNDTSVPDVSAWLTKFDQLYPGHKWHAVNTWGHADSTYCPVCPGLIVSSRDIAPETFEQLFPGWEVVYVDNHGNIKNLAPFTKLKQKNSGKWWVPGEENNDEFTDFVESWLNHWVGYVEETVFDTNILVIDSKNVICSGYNPQVFEAFERHGVTPHIVNFRHRYFWDGGLHCITADLDRN